MTLAILGMGHALPVRRVEPAEPVMVHYGGMSAEADLFIGAERRHAVADAHEVVQLAIEACDAALTESGCPPARIDRLIGNVSPSPNLLPSALYAVHAALGLDRRCLVLPLQMDFATFGASLLLGAEALRCNRALTTLYVSATGWSLMVDPAAPHSGVVGDGAGAAVLGDARSGGLECFTLVDWDSHSLSGWYGAMAVRREHGAHGFGRFMIAPENGPKAFLRAGLEEPIGLVRGLAERNGIPIHEVSVIGHQASRLMLDHWAAGLAPAEVVDTFDDLGNMTDASVVVTLALRGRRITRPFVVLLQLGLGNHQFAALLRRGR